MGELRIHDVLGVRAPPTAGVADIDDFVLGPSRALACEAFLADPRASLYALDPRRDEAAFVVLAQPEHARAQPFLYEAQRAGARALVRVPISCLLEWAARDPKPPPPVFVFSTARSGSTLLVRALDRVPGLHGISEPDVFTQIAEDRRWATDLRIVAIARACAEWLFGHAGRLPGRTVLKVRTQVLAVGPMLMDAWPCAPTFFLHRAFVPSIESFVQAFVHPARHAIERQLAPLFECWLRYRIERDGYGLARHLWPPPGPPPSAALAELGSSYQAVAYWLSAHRWAAAMQAAGNQMLSIDYDELVGNPRSAMRRVLVHCGVGAEHVDAVLPEFARPSQRGSRVVRPRGGTCALRPLDIDRLQRFLNAHGPRQGPIADVTGGPGGS